MSITYKPTEPLEVGIGESMPAEFIKEAERSRARTVSLTDEIKRLKTENAKLRELASGLHQCLDDEGCEGCPMQDDDGWCVRDIRLRELGVEAEQ